MSLGAIIQHTSLKIRGIFVGDGFRKQVHSRSPLQPGTHAGVAGGW